LQHFFWVTFLPHEDSFFVIATPPEGSLLGFYQVRQWSSLSTPMPLGISLQGKEKTQRCLS